MEKWEQAPRPKIETLHRMIDWLNLRSNSSKVELNNSKLEKLGLDLSPLDNYSWFSGFIDADGNF